MADEDVVVGEVEADPIETPENPIVDFMKSVEDQNFTSAEKQFNDMIGDRLQDALDQAKVRIAQSIYGGEIEDMAEPEVEVEDDVEVETDELDDYEDSLDDLDLEEPEDEVELTDDEIDAWDDDVAGV